MVNLLRWSFVIALVAGAGCATSKVVKEGGGWRELETGEAGKTRIEITTDDPRLLAELAKSAPDARIRTEAVLRVKDPQVLGEIVRGEADPALRRAIVTQLTDERILKDLSTNDPDPGVRQAALARAAVLRTVDAKHPEYAGWARCKPGAWVKLKVDLRVEGSRSSVELVRTLLECRPEKAVIEQKLETSGAAGPGSCGELLRRFDLAVGRKVEDDGDLTLSGKTRKCRWVRFNFQRGGDVAQIRRWLLEEVPGGVVRIDLEVSPEGQPLQSLTAVATAWETR